MLQLVVLALPVLVTLLQGRWMVDAAAVVELQSTTVSSVIDDDSKCVSDISVLFIGFRHGARSTLLFLPNDQNNAKWTVGLGQLTPQGMRLQYQNGQLVRQKYAPLFDRYDPTKMLARSSPVDRTLMSASTFFASLIKPQGNQIFRQDFVWQPAALYSTPLLEADVGNSLTDQVATRVMPSIIAMDPKTVDILEDASGIKAQGNGFIFFSLLDNLVTERYAGFDLPYGLNNELEPKIQYLKDQLFMAIFGYDEIRCLLAPQILDDLVTKIDTRLQNKTSQFIYIWSMHDANVFAVLSILNGYRSESPTFASTMFFEVRPYNNNNYQDYEVKLIYRKNVDSAEVELPINGCGSPCSFDGLKAIVDQIKNGCQIYLNNIPPPENEP